MLTKIIRLTDIPGAKGFTGGGSWLGDLDPHGVHPYLTKYIDFIQ